MDASVSVGFTYGYSRCPASRDATSSGLYAVFCIYVSKCYVLGLVYHLNNTFNPLIPLQ